jgi:hypothetical protein
LWIKWIDDTKPWIGLGNPSNDNDHKIFVAATILKVGNGEKGKTYFSMVGHSTNEA